MIGSTTKEESTDAATPGRQAKASLCQDAARSGRAARAVTALSTVLLSFGAVFACAQEPITITRLPDGSPFEIMATQFDLADFGYSSEEYLFSGTASAYVAEGELGRDGHWNTVPGDTAPYVARFFVRRPVDPEAFNGTVHVEWLNVTGQADNAVSWKYGHVEMLRSGTAYIGVTAQLVGSDAAREADPERYGRLSHPGDSFSYDIFSQAAEAIRDNSETILPGLEVRQLIASGDSQSSGRLTTYINGSGVECFLTLRPKCSNTPDRNEHLIINCQEMDYPCHPAGFSM